MTLTPEQFNQLATKDDLNRVEQKIDNLADTVSSMLNAFDTLLVEVKDNRSDLMADQAAHDRFEARITNLETVNK